MQLQDILDSLKVLLLIIVMDLATFSPVHFQFSGFNPEERGKNVSERSWKVCGKVTHPWTVKWKSSLISSTAFFSSWSCSSRPSWQSSTPLCSFSSSSLLSSTSSLSCPSWLSWLLPIAGEKQCTSWWKIVQVGRKLNFAPRHHLQAHCSTWELKTTPLRRK